MKVIESSEGAGDDATPDSGGIELYPRELAQRLGMHLTGSGLFASRASQVPPGHRARAATLDVRIRHDRVADGARGAQSLLVSIEAAFAWEDSESVDPAPWHSVIVERPLADGEPVAGLTATLVADAMQAVGDELIARERVRVGDDQALADSLRSDPREIAAVLWALDLIAHRQRAALFDDVLAALSASDEPSVQIRAIETTLILARTLAARSGAGAMSAEQTQRAVLAITASARFDDPELSHVVIDAVAELGGDEARSFLEFSASGHPDERLRARAADALQALQPTPAPTPP